MLNSRLQKTYAPSTLTKHQILTAFADQIEDGTASTALKNMKRKLPKLSKAFADIEKDPRLDDFGREFYKQVTVIMLTTNTQNTMQQYDKLKSIIQMHRAKKHTNTPIDKDKALNVDLIDILAMDNITVTRNKACCPFHHEKTPSFVIFPNNKYFCFGCHAKGDSINYIMQSRNLNFLESVKYLNNL